jgi:hypothetical protein
MQGGAQIAHYIVVVFAIFVKPCRGSYPMEFAMSDPIRAYIDSQSNRDRVAGIAKRYVSTIVQVAAALQRNPLGVMFSNTTTGMPMTVATDRPIASAGDWPTAEQIQQALAQWHHANQQVLQAWNAVPQADKSSLKPPS